MYISVFTPNHSFYMKILKKDICCDTINQKGHSQPKNQHCKLDLQLFKTKGIRKRLNKAKKLKVKQKDKVCILILKTLIFCNIHCVQCTSVTPAIGFDIVRSLKQFLGKQKLRNSLMVTSRGPKYGPGILKSFRSATSQ